MYPFTLKAHNFCTFWIGIHCILRNNRRGKRRRNEQISSEHLGFLGRAVSEDKYHNSPKPSLDNTS